MMMHEKRIRLLSAAKDVFLRFGYTRVSMNDIAQAAGISRPGLYLVFKSKEDVFKAVYRQWTEETIAEVKGGVSAFRTLREKLRFVFDVWAVRAFEAARQSAEAAELIGCTFGFAADEAKAGNDAFVQCLTTIIAPARMGRRARAGLSSERTARVLLGAVRGLKQTATDVADLRQMIEDLLDLYLA